jgi:hypothetical protein
MISVSGDEDAYNLARVTYVVYHNSLTALTGAVGTYESVSGARVPTYNLLRYVEPGVDNLDSYPVPWTESIDPENPTVTLEGIVDETVASAACPDAACDEAVERAARREIWIRMLSGGDAEVPSAWDDLDYFVDNNRRPEDFVIGENFRYLKADGVQCAADQKALETQLEAAGTPLDFDDVVFNNAAGEFCARVISDANETPIFGPFDPTGPSPAIPTPNTGPQPFFTYWDIGLFTNDDPNTADDKVGPVAYVFWNDARNLIADGLDNDRDNADLEIDGLDNDGDGTMDEPFEGVDEPDEFYGVNVGSPLDARLPRAVTVDFTLFFRSPYPGAPDFNQRFTQRIDLPAGTRRAIKSIVPQS